MCSGRRWQCWARKHPLSMLSLISDVVPSPETPSWSLQTLLEIHKVKLLTSLTFKLNVYKMTKGYSVNFNNHPLYSMPPYPIGKVFSKQVNCVWENDKKQLCFKGLSERERSMQLTIPQESSHNPPARGHGFRKQGEGQKEEKESQPGWKHQCTHKGTTKRWILKSVKNMDL